MGVLERLVMLDVPIDYEMAEEDIVESGDNFRGCKPAMGNSVLDRLRIYADRREDERRNQDRSVREIATSSLIFEGSKLPIFARMGQHLADVKDKCSWNPHYENLEIYLLDKKMSSGHAKRIMNASKVYDVLEGTTTVLPSSEYQIRSLSGLDPIQVQKAWTMAVRLAGNSQPSSRLVTYAAMHIQPSGKSKSGKMGSDSKAAMFGDWNGNENIRGWWLSQPGNEPRGVTAYVCEWDY